MLINRTYKTYNSDYPQLWSRPQETTDPSILDFSSSSSTEIKSSSSSSSSIYFGSYYVCGDLSPNAEGEYIYAGFGKPHPESPSWSQIPVTVPDFNYWQLNDTYYLGLLIIPEIGISSAIIFDFNEEDLLCHEWMQMEASSLVGTYEPYDTPSCSASGVATVSLTPCGSHSSSSSSSSSP